MKHFDELKALPDDEALQRRAEMIDHASDTHDESLIDQTLKVSEELLERESPSGTNHILLHYFRANAFENCLVLANRGQPWSWDVPHFENVLIELRQSIRHTDWSKIDAFRKCQVYTNLANKLNSIGRPVEALEYWDRAISINPNFALALGNRGFGLQRYGQALYDSGHRFLLLLSAYESLASASATDAQFDSVVTSLRASEFAEAATRKATRIDLNAARCNICKEFSLGRSRIERAYRSWCLKNRLFLNPLNDLGNHSIAAQDVLHLPSLVVKLEDSECEPPGAFGLYNQLKQEFVSARWLFYEGLSETKSHFSDRHTHLYDIHNIPSYSLPIEKTKLAFRMAYSLFDKMAFLINDYFNLGVDERRVSFRRIWYRGEKGGEPLKETLQNRQNWPLRGLYWVSKDLYEPTFQKISDPDAKGLADLRHHLEHKYCQVYEDLGIGYSQVAVSQVGLGLRIGRDMLESKGLHLLKLARSSLIYLSLAIYHEEVTRNRSRNLGLVGSMPLQVLKDRR